MMRFTHMTGTQLTDTLLIGTKVDGSAGQWGSEPDDLVYDYDSTVSIPCYVYTGTSDEAEGEASLADAKIRVPFDVNITNLNRVKVTHRHHGELSEPEYYAIIGDPVIEKSAVLLRVKKIMGESRT